MKLTKLAVLTALVVLMPSGGSIQPVMAQSGSAESIDSSFEKAAIKHLSSKFFSRINATNEQRTKISNLVDQRYQESAALRLEIRQQAYQLKELLASDSATDEQIMNKAQELRQLRQKIMEQRLQTALKLRKELTGQQRRLISQRIDVLLGRAVSAPVGL